MTVLGVTSGQLSVERAVVATVRAWTPNYVVAACRRYAAEQAFGRTTGEMEALLSAYKLPFRPRGVTVARSFEEWQVNALPHIQVMATGYTIVDRDQNGLRVRYDIEVAAMVGAQNVESTRLIRAVYEDALLGVLGQPKRVNDMDADPGIWELAESCWVSGGAHALVEDDTTSRTYTGTLVTCQVTVAGVLDPLSGPTDFDPLPDGLPPVVPTDPRVASGGATVDIEPEEVS